jgi:hypothetical protein
MQRGFRDWDKEEMMAYLDWSKAEEGRVQVQVAARMPMERAEERAGTRLPRRGMRKIWEAVEADIEEQEAFYSDRQIQ